MDNFFIKLAFGIIRKQKRNIERDRTEREQRLFYFTKSEEGCRQFVLINNKFYF